MKKILKFFTVFNIILCFMNEYIAQNKKIDNPENTL